MADDETHGEPALTAEDENPAQKRRWTRAELKAEWVNWGWLSLPGGIYAFVAPIMSANDHHSALVGAYGGGCALGVVILLGADYFFTPAPEDDIHAPNPWLRPVAGILAAESAILWIVDSIFN